MGAIQLDLYEARGNELCRGTLYNLALDIVSELTGYNSEQVSRIILPHFNETLGKFDKIDTLHSYSISRRKFDRNRLISEYPELDDIVDSFCFLYRTKIAF